MFLQFILKTHSLAPPPYASQGGGWGKGCDLMNFTLILTFETTSPGD